MSEVLDRAVGSRTSSGQHAMTVEEDERRRNIAGRKCASTVVQHNF